MSRKGKNLRPEVARQASTSGLWMLVILGRSGVSWLETHGHLQLRLAAAAISSCCG